MTHQLSPWIMFLHADLVVQLVMVGLALASVATWTVLVAKSWELRAVRRRIGAGQAILAGATSLYDAKRALTPDHGPVTDLSEAAAAELRLSADMPAAGIKERTASRLDDELARLARSLTIGTGILATIGATAPFIGLFGTVWGIMNSFIGIAHSQTTNLAVVAPGIAEALLATGMGLIAAIPAVVIYNAFARAITGLRAQAGLAAAEINRLVGRDLDRLAKPMRRAAE
ncbi:tonB-system energizer ExbB [Magnetospirillum sulfuroxidans]|uniref:Biopolymer transport protein ExbB n=1 Tax=Magnetospirillum sulfuroxidans TaxID=611300 RepID=A0ABS5I777_9PROT|nr:tonB-system energizer ExbB [Magnetospirillum sulfuroxidans]MBR9970096.1 tonB-system energizer ExbB [Magnetospirillum sulfuroxidans]